MYKSSLTNRLIITILIDFVALKSSYSYFSVNNCFRLSSLVLQTLLLGCLAFVFFFARVHFGSEINCTISIGDCD